MSKIEVFRYNKKDNTYKKLLANTPDDKTIVFFSIRKGAKGKKEKGITLALNKAELAYIILEGKKIYNEMKDKEDNYNKDSSDDDDNDDDDW